MIARCGLAAATAAAVLIGGAGPATAAELPVTSTEDVTPPQVASLSISPLSVDVRDGGNKSFTGTLAATDDLSGVAYAYASYRSPSGSQTIGFSFSGADRTSGDAKSGTYRSTTTITPLAANGTYTLSHVQIQDVVGNYRTYYSADGVAPASLTVLSNEDAVPPVITSVSVAPNPLDVSAGIGSATAEVHVTDDLSGVSYVYGQFMSPSGRQAAGFTATPVSVEPGVARGMTTVARYSEPGDWKLSYLCAVDKAGNQQCFTNWSTPTIANAFPLALSVVSNPADGVRPAVSAFRVSPGGIDVTDGDQTVKTEFDVSDDLAGVQYAYIRFASPRTAGASPEVIQRYGWAYTPSIYTYRWNTDGTYTVQEDDTKRVRQGTISANTVFPRYDRSGDWQVAEVCVVDNVNWINCHSAASNPPVSTLGPTSLTVKWNRTPVVAVTGITQASYTRGSEPVPGCDVSDVEDGVIADVRPVVAGPDAAGMVTVTCSYTDSGGVTGTATRTYEVVTPQNTAPVVTVTGVADTSYQIGNLPAAGCAVEDAEDVGESATPAVAGPSGPLAEYGLGTVTVTCAYTDSGGLTGSATVTYTIVDTTAPTLRLPAPIKRWATSADGATVTYIATATDNSDPDPTMTCSPASGTVFPIGTSTVTCTATDAAGNRSTGTFTVTVVPSCTASGLLQPVNGDGSSVFKLGSTVPLKIALSNCYGTSPDKVVPQVALQRVDTSPDGAVNEVMSSGAANEGTTMRYDPTSAQHIYNLSTKRSQFCSAVSTWCSGTDLTAGTYRATIVAPELATPVTATFSLRK